MLYCDLCHDYVSTIEDDKDIQCLLRDHCLTARHRDAYNQDEHLKELLNEKSKHSTEIQNKQQVLKALTPPPTRFLDAWMLIFGLYVFFSIFAVYENPAI